MMMRDIPGGSIVLDQFMLAPILILIHVIMYCILSPMFCDAILERSCARLILSSESAPFHFRRLLS
jgi:hypothetical protein